MTNRAVLYARVSSDDRRVDGRNLAGQLDMCRSYCTEKGYEVVAELKEDERGASGADFDLPKLSQALDMAQAGAFDVLVTRELDRLARGLAKQLYLENEFQRYGARVEYALADYDDSAEGSLSKNIRAVIADYERLKTIERTRRGTRNSVRAGSVHVQGRPPFGYDVEKDNGKYALRKNDEEAQVVRMVYDWYIEGDDRGETLGIANIAHKLTDMGILTFADRRPGQGVTKRRARGVWQRSSVLRMLKNETFAGVWHYGKEGNSRELIPVEVPAIVSRETWEAAQQQRKKNTVHSKRKRKRPYLVSGRVVCARCGHKMYGTSSAPSRSRYYQYYCCPAHFRHKDYEKPCDLPSFRVDHVDPAVWEWVKRKVLDPEELAKGFESLRADQESELEPLHERVKGIDEQIRGQHARRERLLDLYAEGALSKDRWKERDSQLERTLEELSTERSGLESSLERRTLTEEQIECLADFAAKIAHQCERADADFATQQRVIDVLDLQVRLDLEDGDKVLNVWCTLGEGVFRITTTSTRGPDRHSTRRGRDTSRTQVLLGFEVMSDFDGHCGLQVTAL